MKRLLYLLMTALMVLAVSCQKDNKTNNKDSEPPIGYTFDGGTLFTERLGEDKEDGSIILHIVLKDGVVKDNHGDPHHVTLNYTGKFPFIDCT